eukprot:TRINITY_DN10002_c0_g1_i2.p1 TRINITY_DN10002_c0_g1~~TRINITY_DN10002_c0_g1_i2.p1  ORF type:complete len:174 (+),score=44.77 TRINITY_DN10002_c0_g1_i2:56-577(+)
MSDDLKAMFRAKMAGKSTGSAALQALKRKKQEAKLAKTGSKQDDEKIRAKLRAKAAEQQRLIEQERLQRIEDQKRGIRMQRSSESLPAVATGQKEAPRISDAKAARLAKAEKYRKKAKREIAAVFEDEELQTVTKKQMKEVKDKFGRYIHVRAFQLASFHAEQAPESARARVN